MPAYPGDGELSVWFWPALVVGWLAIGFGIHSALRVRIVPTDLARYTIGAAVVHDGLWAPAAAVVGVITARWLPAWLRSWVRIALALSAVTFLATRPVTGRYGATPTNPSIDPGNAGAFLAVVVAAVWVVCLSLAVLRRRAGDGARR